MGLDPFSAWGESREIRTTFDRVTQAGNRDAAIAPVAAAKHAQKHGVGRKKAIWTRGVTEEEPPGEGESVCVREWKK